MSLRDDIIIELSTIDFNRIGPTDVVDDVINLCMDAAIDHIIFALRDYKGFRHWYDDCDQDDVYARF